MAIYRIKITLQSGKRLAGVGCFLNLAEAQDQTWADYPEASSVSAICLNRRAEA